MDEEQREKIARDLLQRAARASNYQRLPPHIVVHLAFALGDDTDVPFVDAHVIRGESNVSGAVVAFSKRCLYIASFRGVPYSQEVDDDSIVEVTVLPRQSLVKIEIAPVQDEAPNFNEHWGAHALGGRRWPGPVTLTYAGHDDAVTIPRGRVFDGLRGLYPGLLEDLTATVR